MDLKTLTTFVDVAKVKNFAAVARKQDLDPSSISRTIASLEDEIGARLFHRTTRRLSLTQEGEIYLHHVAPLLEELKRARDEVRSASTSPSGRLRMTASIAFGQECIVPLLSAFQTTYPGIELELVMTDANVDLIGERMDLAIRLGPGVGDGLIATKLLRTRYHVVASPEYLKRHPAPLEPGDLSQHNCLRFTLAPFRSRWLFRDRTMQVTEVPVKGKLLLSSALALREAARAGLGPALLADWMVTRDLSGGRLVDLFPNHRAAATTFDTGAWLIYLSRTYLPQKVRLMIDFLKAHLHTN